MPTDAFTFGAQRRGWATLRSLHPAAIDLRRIALIRECEIAELSQPSGVEALLLRAGLNDEGLNELPPELHPHCGGVRLSHNATPSSQNPLALSRLDIPPYLGIVI